MKHGEQVRARILQAGVRAWPNFGVRAIARDVGMSHGAVLYHYGSAAALKDAITAHVLNNKKPAELIRMIEKKL